MVNAFIDASVLADWIIVKLDYKSKKRDSQVILNYKSRNHRAYCSYQIIENIRTKIQDYNFYVSHLSLMEVISVIFEKYIIDEMTRNSISLKYFWKYRNDIKLPDEVIREIYKEIRSFYKVFISKNKIRLTNELNHNQCKHLICRYNLQTHDAILLSEAYFVNCEYFLTNDHHLIQSIRKFNKMYLIKPETFCLKLKIV